MTTEQQEYNQANVVPGPPAWNGGTHQQLQQMMKTLEGMEALQRRSFRTMIWVMILMIWFILLLAAGVIIPLSDPLHIMPEPQPIASIGTPIMANPQGIHVQSIPVPVPVPEKAK